MLLRLLAVSALLTQGLTAPQQFPFHPVSPGLPALHSFNLSPSNHLSLLSHFADYPEQRLVQFAEDEEPVMVTEGEKALLVMEGRTFLDVTEGLDVVMQEQERYPKHLAYDTSTLNTSFAHIDVGAMRTFLTKFSSFKTRYFRSETGRESQLFLLDHLKTLVKTYNSKANITFTEFTHSWIQKSIILRFELPESKTADPSKVVILGAHQDSVNQLPFLPAPGADDDGSGTTTLITILTSLLRESFVPSVHALEFHFYSAEEGGCLGSGDISRAYVSEGKIVRGMMHMDVTAYVKEGTTPVIGLINDGVDQQLVVFMRKLITEYAEIPYADTRCGYGCSDHSSWTKVGAPSSCIAEGKFEDSNPNMHSSRDTIDLPGFSFEHMAQFARVGIAFAWEMAGGKA
uniref:Peptide hydrolase n=1 Tax=Glaciozyma antarctica TaxID=105987 RepID=M9VUI5_9BASI|nr:aminopeptidase [Glaciozyma antarctica]